MHRFARLIGLATVASLVVVCAPLTQRVAAAPAGVPGQQPSDTIVNPASNLSNGGSGPGVLLNARSIPPGCSSGSPTASSGYECSSFNAGGIMNIASETNNGQYVDIVFTPAESGQTSADFLSQSSYSYGVYQAISHSDFYGYDYVPDIANPTTYRNQTRAEVACTVGARCELQLTAPSDSRAALLHTQWMHVEYESNNASNSNSKQGSLYFPVPPATLPTAVAKYAPTGTAPLQYQFDGTASTPGANTSISSYAWDFGDGTTGSGATPIHTYAKSGTYSASLTITDADGGTDSTSLSVVAEQRDLAASITVADPDGKPLTGTTSAVGRPVVATVTLSAAGTAPAQISGVTASPPVTVSPAGRLMQTGGDTLPSGGYTLAPGASVSYRENYQITKVGAVTLSVAADGDEDGTDQTATAQTVAQLGQPLQVDVSFAQNGGDLTNAKLGVNTIQLADNDKGEIPDAMTVTVTVTNTSGGEQDEVSLQPPDLSVVDPASNHDPFPADIAALSDPQIGPMPAGDIVKKEYTMHVTGNQQFKVSQLVLSSDPSLGDTEKSLGAGNLTALPTALVLVDNQPDASVPSHLVTGRLVQFNGTVTNLSNTQALNLDPVLATITGNGGGVTSAEKATPTPDGFLAPVTGKLAAGDKETFHVLVQTMANGGSRSTITFDPSGNAVQSDGSEKALTAAQIRVTSGTSPYLLHLDDSVAAPEQAPDAKTAAYVFTASALEGFRDWAANGFHSLAGLANIGTIGDGVVGAGGIVANNLQADYEIVSVIKAELALHVFWAVLTPAQKSAFAEQVAIDSDAVGDSFKQFHGAVSSGVMSYFQTFQNDFQSGNTVAAYQDFGHGLGSGVPEALSLLAPELVLGKVARGLGWGVKAAGAIGETTVARAISLGAKLKESRIAIGTAKALDGVLAGDNLLASGAKVLKNSFGLAQRDIDIFTNLAKRRNLLIAVRQRNPISTAWLKTKQFLVKSELIKIKNVDALDVEYLGYRGKGGLLGRGDYGTVVFKEPDTISEVIGRLKAKGASADVRKAVLKRFEQREEEWRDYRHLYEEYNDGTKPFDVGFDKKAQGVDRDKVKDIRKFHLDEVKTASGRKYYRVQYSNKAGVLKFVTGDIDIVAILNADGSLPSAAVRALLYDDLLAAVGMQHGDTFAWLKDGELFSKTQAKLLADHLPGNEQLAVFGPDGGCLAAYFDPKLTVFNTVTHDAFATFVGAYTSPLQKIRRYTALALGGIK